MRNQSAKSRIGLNVTPSSRIMRTSLPPNVVSDPRKLIFFKQQIALDDRLRHKLEILPAPSNKTRGSSQRPESAPSQRSRSNPPLIRPQSSTNCRPGTAKGIRSSVVGSSQNLERQQRDRPPRPVKSRTLPSNNDEEAARLRDLLRVEQKKYRDLRAAYLAQARQLQRYSFDD